MMRSKSGSTTVRLYGGEPLLHRDLPKMVEHAVALGLRVDVSTNGILLKEKVDDLYGAGFGKSPSASMVSAPITMLTCSAKAASRTCMPSFRCQKVETMRSSIGTAASGPCSHSLTVGGRARAGAAATPEPDEQQQGRDRGQPLEPPMMRRLRAPSRARGRGRAEFPSSSRASQQMIEAQRHAVSSTARPGSCSPRICCV